MASQDSASGGRGPTAASPPVPLGTVIAGKYRVDQVLASGGMGVILTGHHVLLDQPIAVKMLRPTALENPELVARFSREARAAAKLKSEHVARVIDVGALDDGAPYMVMEYLDGTDLSRLVKERGALPAEEAIDYVLQACVALAEAHGLGIIHRDLKPANLFVIRGPDDEPMVKVLDFGISKVLRQPDDAELTDNLTQTSMLMGSPHYMSPEQLKNAKQVDARSDVWSMGAVLFKLLTGVNSFEAATTPELCVQILMGEPRRLTLCRADLPQALEDVIARCLAKDPAARYASVSELAQALHPFAHATSHRSVLRIGRTLAAADSRRNLPDTSGRTKTGSGLTPLPIEMREPSPSLTTASSSAASREIEVVEVGARPRRWPLLLAAAAAALLLVVGAAAFVGPAVLGGGRTAASRIEAPSAAPTQAPDTAPTAPPTAAATTATAATSAAPTIAAASAAPARSGQPPRLGVVIAPPKATASATPAATAAATAATPATTATGFLPEFGGRK